MYCRLLSLVVILYVFSCGAHPIQRDISGHEYGATKQAQEIWDAVAAHDLQRVKRLLSDENVNTYHPDDKGDTLLLRALCDGSTSIADYLIQKGASPHDEDARGEKPLNMAAIRGYADIARNLIHKGGCAQ